VPAACRVGVRTPELVVFDLSRSILAAPVTVYRRVHGDTLGRVLDRRPDCSAALRGIGRDLARLHLEVTAVDDPSGWLDQPDTEDAREWLDSCARAGLVRAERRLVERWIDRLEPTMHAHVHPRFLHNDVHPFNVMVDRAGDCRIDARKRMPLWQPEPWAAVEDYGEPVPAHGGSARG
jgi:hygromycin-B 7''-O-kinase